MLIPNLTLIFVCPIFFQSCIQCHSFGNLLKLIRGNLFDACSTATRTWNWNIDIFDDSNHPLLQRTTSFNWLLLSMFYFQAFNIVVFTTSNTVDFVPKSWMVGLDRTFSPRISKSKLTCKRSKLEERDENWPIYEVRILGQASKLYIIFKSLIFSLGLRLCTYWENTDM